MATTIVLQGKRRTALGKSVRRLRATGMVPANIYGHGVTSMPIEVEERALKQALQRAGRSRVLDLRLEDDSQAHPVLTRDVKRDARTGRVLHVDFYQVRMDELVRARVPIHFIGEAPATRLGNATLLHLINALEVEARPGDLPNSVTVDVSELNEVDDAIHAGGIPLPPNVVLKINPDELIVKVAGGRVQEPEEAAAEVAPATAAGTSGAEIESAH